MDTKMRLHILFLVCYVATSLDCLEEREKAIGNPRIGSFLPRCQENGDYEPMQCHGSIGYCWCSLPDGTIVGEKFRAWSNDIDKQCKDI